MRDSLHEKLGALIVKPQAVMATLKWYTIGHHVRRHITPRCLSKVSGESLEARLCARQCAVSDFREARRRGNVRMTTLTDLSQLTKSMVKKPVEEPKPAPKPKAQEPPVDREAAEVLAYFARPGGYAPRRERVASCADPAKDRVAELEAALEAKDAALDALAGEKATMGARIAELERRLAAEREAHEAAARERDRLQGECGRLQGELRKAADDTDAVASARAASVVQAGPTKPIRALLAANCAIAEAFPGEVREQVLAALADALAAAQQSGRERRAGVLADVLASNPPSGELERRRTELKQILKDAGYFNDPKPLEKLGFKLISGRTHWKLQYANVRITMSKTPSDYRANLNAASDTANRCF